MSKKILSQIMAIRESFVGAEFIYSQKSSYQFFKILQSFYPQAQAYSLNNQIVSKIDNKFYNISGGVDILTNSITPYFDNLEKDFTPGNIEDCLLHKEYKEAIDKTAIVSKTDIKGIITYANDSFCEISGYSQKELLGKSHGLVKHPDTPLAIYKKMWDTILVKKLPWKGELKNIKKDGTEYTVNATIVPQFKDGNLISFIGIRYDITELDKHKLLNQTIIDKQKEIIIIGHKNKGITAANKSFFKNTNFNTIKEFNEKHTHIQELVSNKSDIEQYKLENLENLKNVDIQNIRLANNKNSYKLSLKRINSSEYLITLTDVTKMADLITQAQNESFMKSNFLATMSHEIRTPLNGIIPYIDILLDTYVTTEQKEYLDIIKTSSSTLLGVINDILDFSKIESGKMEIDNIKFNVSKEIENLVNIYTAKTNEKEINFCTFIDPLLPKYIYGDILRIKQIINNLLSNAIKFTNNNGKIKFGFEVVEFKNKIVIVKISVSDSGIGISKDNQKMMFKPFSQENSSITRNFGGTGLGLSISQNLAISMGSEIKLESTLNKGSNFSLLLQLPYSQKINNYLSVNGISNISISIYTPPSNKTNCKELIEMYLKSFKMKFKHIKNFSDYNKNEILIVLSNGKNCIEWINKDNFKNEKVISIIPTKEINSNQFYYTNIITMPLNGSKLFNAILNRKQEIKNITLSNTTNIYYNAKVLIAEDNSTNRTIVKALLKKFRIETVFANDGVEAIKQYKIHHKELDLVLMDIHMPKLDGVEATKRILELQSSDTYRTIPIIGLSADAIKTHQDKYMKIGMSDFLSKPIETDKFNALLEKYLISKKAKEDEIVIIKKQELIESKKLTKVKMIQDNLKLDEKTSLMLFDNFIQNWTALKPKLYSSIENLDYKEIGSIAHQLKGAAGSLKLLDIHKEAENLEEVGKNVREKCSQTRYFQLFDILKGKFENL